MNKDQVLELNAAHPIVVGLNKLRKSDKNAAKLVARQFFDNVMVQSGIPFDLTAGCERQYKLLSSYLDLVVGKIDTKTGAEEEVIIEASEP